MKKQHTRKGFTITELVIVIVVIAILAAVLIPTFASLIKKANESADVQLVREINIILSSEEKISGKPATAEGAKLVLEENGLSNIEPSYSGAIFCWNKADNRVAIVDKESGKATFPKEYKGTVILNADGQTIQGWDRISGMIRITVAALGGSFDEALEAAKPGHIIVLDDVITDENKTINLKKDVGLDLAGETVDVKTITMEANSTSTISNGTLKIDVNLEIPAGAKLILDNVTVDASSEYAVYPAQEASEVTIKGSTITNGEIGIFTRNNHLAHSNNVIINVIDSTIKAPTGILLAVPGEINVINSTIESSQQCVFARAGVVNVKDSSLNFTRTEAFNGEYFSTETTCLDATNPNGQPFEYGQKAQCWGTLTNAPRVPVLVGDFFDMYPHDASCTLDNVKVTKANDTYPDVFISQDVCESVRTDVDHASTPKAELFVKNGNLKWLVNTGKYTFDGAPAEFGFYQHDNLDRCKIFVDNVFVNGEEKNPGDKNY